MVNLYLFSIRLHVWCRSDDKRHMHNHAFDFISIVLMGGYTDVSLNNCNNLVYENLSVGSIVFRKASHIHFVGWPRYKTVTLLFCGRKKQNWGFLVKNKIMRPLRYFSRYGHPDCNEP